MIDDYKKIAFSRHKRQVYLRTFSNCDSMTKIHTRLRQTKSQHRTGEVGMKSGHKRVSFWNLIANVRGKGIYLFIKDVKPVKLTTLQGRSQRVFGQYKLDLMG